MKTPKLPKFINTKIYKTGQTRGADDDVIFQNRVARNSTVLIPYSSFEDCLKGLPYEGFEKGYIVLISPEDYFESSSFKREMSEKGLKIGKNALLFYDTRTQWEKFNPLKQNLNPATNRENPLKGEFIARVASTTSKEKNRENHGFNTTGAKGAGIRVYEYAPKDVILKCRIQLEFLFWSCFDSIEMSIQHDIEEKDAITRKKHNKKLATENGLDIIEKLLDNRMINSKGNTICPLCLDELSSAGFFKRVAQAKGRKVKDLTITEINLFHIKELRTGEYNHQVYNLGWGHHHCNVVVKDAGIAETLNWMESVLKRNDLL